MASPWRIRLVPQCTACLRHHTLLSFPESSSRVTLTPYSQVRGKKKMAKSPTLPVRLLQDVATYGRKGSIVPTTRGLMRSIWFSAGIASYIPTAEMRQLRVSKVPIERDFGFGAETLPRNRRAARRIAALEGTSDSGETGEVMSADAIASASAFQKDAAQRARISPERSMELVEIFVPPRVEFYRQPIVEDSVTATSKAAAVDALTDDEQALSAPQSRRAGRGAAAELLAVRTAEAQKQKAAAAAVAAAKSTPQAIYGSVSAHEVLVAIRAAMAENDEAARVVLQDGDVRFVDLPDSEVSTEGDGERDRVKHVGDFTVEISIKGAEKVARRIVRVIAQGL